MIRVRENVDREVGRLRKNSQSQPVLLHFQARSLELYHRLATMDPLRPSGLSPALASEVALSLEFYHHSLALSRILPPLASTLAQPLAFQA